ncbi:MAG TPA: hypothetical protein PKV86_10385, partial [Syntrophobacteraceae bacterium]|nr:hypothetical protein [Syntrophobacteraceae bacterium]
MKHLGKTAFLLALTVVWFGSFWSNVTGAPIMVAKNLFARDRKPPSPESDASPAQSNKPGLSTKSIQLDGVLMRGDERKAILRLKGQLPGAEKGKGQKPYVTVKEGDKVGDFQVVKIENRSLSLERDGQTEVIYLFGEGKVVIPPPSVPSTPKQSQVQPGERASSGPQPPFPHRPGDVNMPRRGQPANVVNAPGGR